MKVMVSGRTGRDIKKALNRKKMEIYIQNPNNMESEMIQFSLVLQCSIRFPILEKYGPKPLLEHGQTKVY